MKQQILPCATCDRKTARCSTTCKRLHKFLRWTDKNRANILGRKKTYPEHEIPYEPRSLELISDQQMSDETSPDISIQRLFESSTDYGAIDISYLSTAEGELYGLYYCQQFTAQQIADMWGLTPKKVHDRLYYIRKKIKKHYLGKFVKSYTNTP